MKTYSQSQVQFDVFFLILVMTNLTQIQMASNGEGKSVSYNKSRYEQQRKVVNFLVAVPSG